VDMLPPTLISGDFDSLRCDVLNYYDNVLKVIDSQSTAVLLPSGKYVSKYDY